MGLQASDAGGQGGACHDALGANEPSQRTGAGAGREGACCSHKLITTPSWHAQWTLRWPKRHGPFPHTTGPPLTVPAGRGQGKVRSGQGRTAGPCMHARRHAAPAAAAAGRAMRPLLCRPHPLPPAQPAARASLAAPLAPAFRHPPGRQMLSSSSLSTKYGCLHGQSTSATHCCLGALAPPRALRPAPATARYSTHLGQCVPARCNIVCQHTKGRALNEPGCQVQLQEQEQEQEREPEHEQASRAVGDAARALHGWVLPGAFRPGHAMT